MKKMKPPRRLGAVAICAVIAAAVAVTPSFADSPLSLKRAVKMFLTHEEAANTYVSQKQAARTYVSDSEAERVYLRRDRAGEKFATIEGVDKKYARKTDLPAEPVVAVQASTVDFGPATGEDPVDLPTSYTNFRMDDTGPVALTFTTTAKCEADVDGTGCPLRLLVDGYPTSTGPTNIVTSDPGADPEARTITQTTIVTKGIHTASVEYAGSDDPSVKLTLSDWNLVVQGYPGQ
jgi:hypothetical protein